jgi:hypothetical protein
VAVHLFEDVRLRGRTFSLDGGVLDCLRRHFYRHSISTVAPSGRRLPSTAARLAREGPAQPSAMPDVSDGALAIDRP